MPSLPIERGLPGPGLLAHIAISKFCDHQPLHRQSAIYAREGVELDRALMADWMGKVVFLLTPLAEAIGRHIRAGEVLHADDTTVPVLSPGLGRTATGRLWAELAKVPPAQRVECQRRGWSATNGRGVRPFPLPCSIAIPRIAGASMPRRCSVPAAAFYMPTAMLDSTGSTGPPPRPLRHR